MTYNVLADWCMQKNMEPYLWSSRENLDLSRRVASTLEEIQQYDPDILTLQEVDAPGVQFTGPLGSVYSHKFKKRLNFDNDGVMILWKTAKYDLVFYREVEFFAPDSRLYCKPNIGLICGLVSPSEPNKLLIVATTHVLYNQRRGDIQAAQLDFLIKSIAYCRNFYSALYSVSVLLSGDFNLTPCSPLYSYLKDGFLDLLRLDFNCLSRREEGRFRLGRMSVRVLEESCMKILEAPMSERYGVNWKNSTQVKELIGVQILDEVEVVKPDPNFETRRFTERDLQLIHDLRLSSASVCVGRRELFPTVLVNDDASTVDYLWISQDISVVRLLELPGFKELVELGPMPNRQYPSDHFSLVFELNY